MIQLLVYLIHSLRKAINLIENGKVLAQELDLTKERSVMVRI
jgi:hypothetical protein